MQKETVMDNIRAPIMNTIYRSPFEGLHKHSQKIDECVRETRACVYSYLEGDFKRAEEHSRKVRLIEGEADKIKANVRSHLPKFILLSVSKSDFHQLLHHSDSILDYAEDVAVLLMMKRTRVDDQIAADMKELTDKVLECVKAYQKVMEHMNVLIEVSFTGKERTKVKGYIKKIHKYEHEADLIEYRVSKKLFNMEDEMDPIAIIHLLKVIDRMGQIANQAENAGDKIRAMLAK
ncbi:MAG: TIGR00153 family protein [Thermoplasmatota archaeon]